MPSIRPIRGLIDAARTVPRPMPPPIRAAAKLGLAFERRVGRELSQHVAAGRIAKVEHNPWFNYTDKGGVGFCCPDFLLLTDFGLTIVEVKLTWVAEAAEKLRLLYTPVVAHVFGKTPSVLVLCRRLAETSPVADVSLRTALAKPSALLLWPGNGGIPW